MSEKARTLLHYLHTHSYEQAKKVFPPEVLAEVQDQEGKLTLIFETPEKFKELIISVNDAPYFKGDSPFYPLENTHIQALSNAEGVFYISGEIPPTGASKFWLAQYPPRRGETVGRTVLEFYTSDRITAIFKTDVDNFGGEGSGNFL